MIYLGVCLYVIVMNFATDIRSVQNAAETLHKHVHISETTVEAIAFIQIVFENTLLTEYLHVISEAIHH